MDEGRTQFASQDVLDELARLRAERDRAVETRENANTVSLRVEAENRRLREGLEAIANMDYRGNRSRESQIAYRALHPEKNEASDG